MEIFFLMPLCVVFDVLFLKCQNTCNELKITIVFGFQSIEGKRFQGPKVVVKTDSGDISVQSTYSDSSFLKPNMDQ